ncbi:MAG: EAL domain-containing protein [Vulcanimicrobiaceae bacterium]
MLSASDLARLESTLRASPLGIVAWDKDARFSYWSQRAADIFGYTAEEMLGRRVLDVPFIDDGDRDLIRGLAQRVDGPSPLPPAQVVRHVRKDGTKIICRWFNSVIADDERHHIFDLVEDITESTLVAGRIQDSEERFRSFFANNPDGVIMWNTDGLIVDANDAALRMGGLTRDELIGADFRDFLVQDEIPRNEEFVRRALAGETLFFTTRAKTPARLLELFVTTVPVHTDGQTVGAFSILRDETERNEAERRLTQQEREIRESERRFRSLFENNPNAVLVVDLSGKILDANEATYRIGNRTPDSVIGRSFVSEESDPEKSARLWAFFRRALEGSPVSFETPSVSATGRALELEVTIVPRFAAGKVNGAYIVLQDVTDRKDAERRAEQQAARIRDLYFIAASGDYSETRLHATLQMGARVFGAEAGAVVDCTMAAPALELRFDGATDSRIPDQALIDAALAVKATADPVAQNAHGFGTRLTVGGELYGALVFASTSERPEPLGDTDRDLLALMAALLSGALERRRTRARLRTLAYYDALTGLPNRVYFQERVRDALAQAQESGKLVAVLFFDLDRFKDINDTLGHALGDRLLQLVAERLVDVGGKAGTVARMGGDEFIILLSDCDNVETIRATAESLLQAVDDPYHLDKYEQYITTSIGIAVYPDDGRDDQTLIKNADIAMYRAKDRGRNGYYFYNPTLEAPIHSRLSQEKHLRRALERNQFLLHYQPIVEVSSGKLVAVETLVRWQHPQKGLLFPDQFIPGAEASGLIVQLGEWVLVTAARQLQDWRQRFGPFHLAVNLSARQFHQRDLRERVALAVSNAGLVPGDIEIEITESVAMTDAAHAIETVRELKRSGVRIAVDDFGTGHSSLSYLRRFDVDSIKIDRSFVDGIGSERGDETIVKTLIAMGHSLGLTVIAEGVETLEQYAFLKEHGCDRVQGYFISPPVEARALEELLASRRETLVKPG